MDVERWFGLQRELGDSNDKCYPGRCSTLCTVNLSDLLVALSGTDSKLLASVCHVLGDVEDTLVRQLKIISTKTVLSLRQKHTAGKVSRSAHESTNALRVS